MAFKRYNPTLKLSLEQNTPQIPSDGDYYLLLDGEIIRHFKSKSAAMTGFNRMREELGFKVVEADDLTPEQRIQQERVWMEYYRSEEYWGSASSFRSGGKLSNR